MKTIENITKILTEFKDFPPDSIHPETTFEEIGLDSLDIVDLVMKIEDEIGVKIPMSPDIKTVGHLVKFIDDKKISGS